VNILDENIPRSQRELLRRWRIRVRQIGVDIGRRGLTDEEVVPFLRQLRRPTFFTRDEDFFDRRLCHARYALVHLDVQREEAAAFVRRVLSHPALNTQAKRMGAVIRVARAGLSVWRFHAPGPVHFRWTD
jgi:hypothetical protein